MGAETSKIIYSAQRAETDATWQTLAAVENLRLLSWLPASRAGELFLALQHELHWNQGHYWAFERRFFLPRLQAWYADVGVNYRYAKQLLNSHPWTPLLAQLRDQVQTVCGYSFNAVLANYYRNGEDSVGWHADNETDLGPEPILASLSLGAPRTFYFRHVASGQVYRHVLNAGDLLLMLPGFQQAFEHAVLPEPGVQQPRINLTFRQVMASAE